MVSIDFTLLIVILNFILLLVILNKVLYKPIKNFLSQRQSRISKDIDEAASSRVEAEELLKTQEEEYKKHTNEIRKMFEKKTKEAEFKADEIIKEALKEKENRLNEFKEQLETEKKRALKEIETQIGSLVSDLAGKFLSEKIGTKEDKVLLDSLLQDRSNQ